MGFADQSISPKVLKREINIQQVFSYFDIEIDENSKCLCPFHEDKNPSMLVNSEFAYCFACGRGWDVFDFLKEYLQIEFEDTLFWLNTNKELLPDVKVKSRKRGEYRGPVSSELVQYWHSCLTHDHRMILHEKRLLTDDFIDRWLLGWRPDWNAFSIPFWSGVPQKSEIDIVQFRLTPESPEFITKYTHDSKFIGLPGHNRPSLIGTHSLKDWGVLVFGTFDALLAIQDGFPCVSPNGASVFSTKKTKPRLIEMLKDVKRLFVVYDATESERSTAQKTVKDLACDVVEREFVKHTDYGEYRLYHDPEEFMTEILKWRIT